MDEVEEMVVQVAVMIFSAEEFFKGNIIICNKYKWSGGRFVVKPCSVVTLDIKVFAERIAKWCKITIKITQI